MGDRTGEGDDRGSGLGRRRGNFSCDVIYEIIKIEKNVFIIFLYVWFMYHAVAHTIFPHLRDWGGNLPGPLARLDYIERFCWKKKKKWKMMRKIQWSSNQEYGLGGLHMALQLLLMVLQLKANTSLAEDVSLIHSTCIRWLTALCSFSQRIWRNLPASIAPEFTYTYPHTHTWLIMK